MASVISDKKFSLSWIVFLYSWSVLSFWVLPNFFFVFSFQKFDYDVSFYGFLWVYPIVNLLRFMNVSSCVLQIWGIFQPFFLILFSSSFFGALESRQYDCMNAISFVIVPKALKVMLSNFSFSLFSLCCSDSFLSTFLCPLHSAVEPIHWVFCLHYFSTLKFPCSFPLYLLFLC